VVYECPNGHIEALESAIGRQERDAGGTIEVATMPAWAMSSGARSERDRRQLIASPFGPDGIAELVLDRRRATRRSQQLS
jgi:hypothetical protein